MAASIFHPSTIKITVFLKKILILWLQTSIFGKLVI